jgi:hypothetical protein
MEVNNKVGSRLRILSIEDKFHILNFIYFILCHFFGSCYHFKLVIVLTYYRICGFHEGGLGREAAPNVSLTFCCKKI